MSRLESVRQDQRQTESDKRGSPEVIRPEADPIIGSICAAGNQRRLGKASGSRFVRGFTLVELMLVVAVAGVLSGVAYPSFMGQLQKIRRSDAFVSIMQMQAAQERWRANNPSYGSLADIAISSTSNGGHYALLVTAQLDTGYEVLASALGVQANDAPCRNLRLRVDGGNLVQTSGPDAATNNAQLANRQCWSL